MDRWHGHSEFVDSLRSQKQNKCESVTGGGQAQHQGHRHVPPQFENTCVIWTLSFSFCFCFMCMNIFVCLYICVSHVCSAYGDQERVLASGTGQLWAPKRVLEKEPVLLNCWIIYPPNFLIFPPEYFIYYSSLNASL